MSGTHKPCPGCGGTDWRRTKEVCSSCKKLLEEGKLFKDALRKQAEKKVISIRDVDNNDCYSVPGTYLGGDVTREWTKAVGLIIKTVGIPCPWLPELKRVNILKNQGGLSHRSHVEAFPPGFPDALQSLVDITGRMINAAYNKGLGEGSNILIQLASGEITADEFNKLNCGIEGED